MRPTPSGATYLRRRLGAALVAGAVVIVAAVTIGVAVGGLGGEPAYASESPAAVQPTTEPAPAEVHVARSGDSLWSIADEHRQGRDRTEYIGELIDLNGSASIQIGQAVVLP